MTRYYSMAQIEAFIRIGYIVTIVGCAKSIAAPPHVFACRIEEPPTPAPSLPPLTDLDELIALMQPILAAPPNPANPNNPFPENVELIAEMIRDGTNDRDRWTLMLVEIVWLEQRGFVVTRLDVAGMCIVCRVEAPNEMDQLIALMKPIPPIPTSNPEV